MQESISKSNLSVGSEESELRQKADRLEASLREINGAIDKKCAHLEELDLNWRQSEHKLQIQVKRRQQLTQRLDQLIKSCNQMELDFNIKSIELDLEEKRDFGTARALMDEQSRYWRQSAAESAQEEWRLNDGIRRLETDLSVYTQHESLSRELAVDIPKLKQIKTTLEKEFVYYLSDNTDVKLRSDQLALEIDILGKRNAALLKRLRNQLLQSQQRLAANRNNYSQF